MEILVEVVHSSCRILCDLQVLVCHIQLVGQGFTSVLEHLEVFFIHFRALSCQLDAVPYFHDNLVLRCRHLVGWYLLGTAKLLVARRHRDEGDVDHLLVAGRDCGDGGGGWLSCGSQANWHSFIEVAEGSEVEGIFLSGFGDVGNKWARDVRGNEAVTP